jgi:hypothetical protein
MVENWDGKIQASLGKARRLQSSFITTVQFSLILEMEASYFPWCVRTSKFCRSSMLAQFLQDQAWPLVVKVPVVV